MLATPLFLSSPESAAAGGGASYNYDPYNGTAAMAAAATGGWPPAAEHYQSTPRRGWKASPPEARSGGGDVGGGKGDCAVCGDVASGTHYRVLTCEGCKGFWRRTIQRGTGHLYKCRTGSHNCVINTQFRGRCQRCRYQACVSAGMVADLVMSEKERLSRIRLVDQNRERRRGGNQDTPTHQDAKVLALVEQIYSQYFPAGQEYNFTQVDLEAARHFSADLQRELNKGKSVSTGLCTGVLEEILVLLTAHKMASSGRGQEAGSCHGPVSLQTNSPLIDFSRLLARHGLIQAELTHCLALVLTRPRLTWPVSSRPELASTWQLVSSAVRRKYGGGGGEVGQARYGALLQVLHMTSRAAALIKFEELNFKA